MKTLKNIHEGFFSNVGATGALYKNKVIEYLENIKNVNTKSLYIREMSRYTLEEAIEEAKNISDEWFNNGLGDLLSKHLNANEIRHLKWFFTRRLIITADVFDPKTTTLPTWFKLNDFVSFYKNAKQFFPDIVSIHSRATGRRRKSHIFRRYPQTLSYTA